PPSHPCSLPFTPLFRSDPAVSIAAGTKTKETGAYTPFRNIFYGASTTKPALDSAAIRALTATGKAYAAGTLTINVPAGAQRVVRSEEHTSELQSRFDLV